jgi:predicted Zn-dependent protease
VANVEGLFGAAEAAHRDVALARKLSSSRTVARVAAGILALSGFPAEAQPLLDQTLREFPSTANAVYVPSIRAALDLAAGSAGAAIDRLKPAAPYDTECCGLGTAYLRALAYLAAHQSVDAAAEFQKLVDLERNSFAVFVPLARLGLARALAQAGDSAKSRAAYEEFFTAWKEADSDIPILVAARQEYARLK